MESSLKLKITLGILIDFVPGEDTLPRSQVHQRVIEILNDLFETRLDSSGDMVLADEIEDMELRGVQAG